MKYNLQAVSKVSEIGGKSAQRQTAKAFRKSTKI